MFKGKAPRLSARRGVFFYLRLDCPIPKVYFHAALSCIPGADMVH